VNHLSRGIVLGFCLTVTGGVAALATAACTPAQSAAWSTVEQTVLTDVEAGKGIVAIESDVATDLVGVAGPTVVLIVNDILTALEDLGAFSALAAKRVPALHTALLAQHAAMMAPPGSLR
jgi:hypothetical protein